MHRHPGRVSCLSAFLFACACAGGIASATPAGGQEKTVIRIGALVDQTGASTSPLFRTAVELAASQMNQALARARSRLVFEVVFGDTKSNPAQGQAEAIRLINQEGAVALVSDSSGVTVAVNKLNYDPASIAKQKVPVTCFQCSSGFINDAKVVETDPMTQAAERDLDNWLFRVFYIAKYEAAVLTQIALKTTNNGKGNGDGNFKIGIFADGGHRSLATSIADTVKAFYSGSASTEITYFSSVANLAADWAKVVDDRNEGSGQADGVPDVVIVAMLPNEAAEAIKAYRQAGYTIPILSNNSFRRNYILKQIGAVANGLEGSSVTLVDKGKSGQAFLKAFRDATGGLPEVTSSGAYDATVTLMLAAAVAAGDARKPQEVTPAAIRVALTKINERKGTKIRPVVGDFVSAIRAIGKGKSINYEGAYNALDWDAVGDIYPPLVHWKVENAQFVEYELYDCDPQKPLCPAK